MLIFTAHAQPHQKPIAYLVALERPYTLAELDAAGGTRLPRGLKLPELNRLVKTTADKVPTIGRKSDRINTVLVTIRILQAFDQVAGRGIPNADTLIQRTGSNIATFRRHGNGSNPVFNAQSVHEMTFENIPKAHRLVTATRRNKTSVARIIEGVDILFMSAEDVLDCSGGNIPDLVNNTVSIYGNTATQM